MSGVTTDRLMGGRVVLRQPAAGYRAATDPVLLAASIPAEAGQRILDLGAGVGTVGLCLAARVPGVTVDAVEIDPGLAALAQENAAANGAALTVWRADIRDLPIALRTAGFDHVTTNPPWHAADTLGSPDPVRDRANREGDVPLADWLGVASARLRPRGTLTVIQRVERLPEILAALEGRGRIAVLPIAARTGREAKRVIVRMHKTLKGPFRLAAPLVMHDGAAHLSDSDDSSAAARAVLANGAKLDL